MVITPELAQRAKKIKLLVLDVDGVLTDGSVVYDHEGREIKFFNVRDGHGLKLFQRAGYKIVWLSGRGSAANRVRAKELQIDHLLEDTKIKLPALEDIMKAQGVTPEETAFMGDDLIDLPPMRIVGLAMTPADGIAEARQTAHWVSDFNGGKGAVRQAVELIMKCSGKWEEVTARYFD